MQKLNYDNKKDANCLEESSLQLKPFQLVSLWEMIQISLGKIAAIVSLLTEWQSKLKVHINYSKFLPFPNNITGTSLLSESTHQALNVNNIKELLEEIKKVVNELGLAGSEKFLEQIVADLDKITLMNLQDNLKKLEGIIEAELSEQWAMHIPKNSAWWLNNDNSFGVAVKNAFPSALEDIKEVGNCYALDRPTACVFHSMRILEHGLDALANDVGLVFDVQNWQNIIEQIESEIRKQAKLPKTAEKDARLQFLSAAAKEFMYFKDGWRNHVSHKRTTYDTYQAYSILSHVRSFMMHLAKQLKETQGAI